MADKLDIIIFGATGFTGKHTIPAVYKLTKDTGKTWGIAGRSEKKLQDVLAEVSATLDTDLSQTPIIIADVADPESLLNMTARARIIVNTCGPYRFFGEPVIKACVESGTHHVDVSGEPQYMETMQLKYHAAAMEKGIYIVSACGFDSVPMDLGIIALQEKFEGTINSVESYLQMVGKAGTGAVLNYGTWESAVYGLAHYDELRKIRSELFPNRLPDMKPRLKFRGQIHKSDVTNGWVVPFLGSDRSVALRSQRFFYEVEKKRPIQVQAYLSVKSFFLLLIMAVIGGIFSLLAKFELGRKLLLAYPAFFSAGFASREGPSKETMENTKFEFIMVANGWKKDAAVKDGEFVEPPNETLTISVRGTNPGYGFTCYSLVLTAMMVLNESDKMPNRGGVYAPAAAFAKTSLLKELQNNGLQIKSI